MQSMSQNTNKQLLVCEQFHSIQGEGKRTGVNSHFLRMSGCNLSCSFCDSKFTWTHQPEELERVGARDLAITMADSGATNLVITGGEPLIHDQAMINEWMKEFMVNSWARHRYPSVEFETNGTIVPIALLNSPRFNYNVSVKLSNSSIPIQKRVIPKAIEAFNLMALNFDNVIFKFVVSGHESFREMQDLITAASLRPKDIWVMPMGTDSEVLNETAREMFFLCLENGYNLSGRMHVELFGNKRGI